MDLLDKQNLIRYLQQHGLYTKKKLGQNFLVDRGALDKIVEAAELSEEDCVIEVGSGLGVLTEELVKRVGKVMAVELDNTLARLLADHFSLSVNPTSPSVIPAPQQVRGKHPAGILDEQDPGSPHYAKAPRGRQATGRDDSRGRLEVINSDILRVNINELTKDCLKYKVVANIPYYITSKILRFFLEAEKKPELIVLLTQKEVAERICAKPGEMSVLPVSVQYYGRPEIVDIVPRTSFFPRPEVDSAILKISDIRLPSICHSCGGRDLVDGEYRLKKIPHQVRDDKEKTTDKDFFRCVHIGFSSRRKTLFNNLSAGYRLDKTAVLDILKKVKLDEKTRAQELSVEKWKELCEAENFRS